MSDQDNKISMEEAKDIALSALEDAEKNRIEDPEQIEEANNSGLSRLLVTTTIQLASNYAVAEDMDTRLNISTALSILAIATNMDQTQAMRMINIARRIAKI